MTQAHHGATEGQYPPYYERYVSLAPEGDIVGGLAEQGARLAAAWRALPDAARGFRYAEGKWTVEEILGHIVDIERVFSYRAMCFLRGIEEAQPGVDHNVMVPRSGANQRGLESLILEFEHLRAANVELFRGLDAEAMDRRGTASGGEFAVRAVVSILYGHADHHDLVLSERYLTAL